MDYSLTADSSPAGLEGERCLRSSDCSGGLCCARHFWSKICKPVLREGQVSGELQHTHTPTHPLLQTGVYKVLIWDLFTNISSYALFPSFQVCTKHRKKGALGLEIFQRCDCGAGFACRTQRGAEEQRMHKAARALHTCQQH